MTLYITNVVILLVEFLQP